MSAVEREVVVCLDSFKGSVDSLTASTEVAEVLGRHLSGARAVPFAFADGGEGTIRALAAAGWDVSTTVVTGAFGEPRIVEFAHRADEAVVEVAEIVGLPDSPRTRDACLDATTYGVGELLAHVQAAGFTSVTLALGGSSTSDGGVGMLSALGAAIADGSGAAPIGARGLRDVRWADLSLVRRRFAGVRVQCATDVTNPLLGPHGAAAVFGPQKGATSSEVDVIEEGLRRLVAVLGEDEISGAPGAGAAGGLGFAAITGMSATIISGARFVAESTGMLETIRSARAVIVGEGRLDEQTLAGKGPGFIAEVAKAAGVPCFAIVGQLGIDPSALETMGIRKAVALVDLAPSTQDAIDSPAEYLRRAARLLAEELDNTTALG